MDRRFRWWGSYARIEAFSSGARVASVRDPDLLLVEEPRIHHDPPALQLRVTGGGRHPRLGEVKDVLFNQIVFLRSKKEKVWRQWIQASARKLAKDELDDDDFYASDKSLARFMTRYGLSL